MFNQKLHDIATQIIFNDPSFLSQLSYKLDIFKTIVDPQSIS